ncbi:sulfate permease [Microbacterium oxydans]|uniref:sulfate permease n=1 Tax=Microbacterium TaxID=33882 RepID=UPI0014200183|nr:MULTISPECIES: sulfate permease [Microbacterium]MDZ4045059.1 sulfate permease [Rhodoglobus sp.]NIG66299.1 sulfate permease [Microbacterium sp. Be9]
MIRSIWTVSIFIHAVLQRCAPTNIVLGRIRRRCGLKWGVLAMFLAVPYLIAASLCSAAISDGAPGWLNLIILLCLWNAMKFIAAGPVAVVLLLRARRREAVARRVSERAHAAVELVAA